MSQYEVAIANDPFYILLAVEAPDAESAELKVADWLATPEGQALGEDDAREGKIVGLAARFAYSVFRVRECDGDVGVGDTCGPFGMIGSGGNG